MSNQQRGYYGEPTQKVRRPEQQAQRLRNPNTGQMQKQQAQHPKQGMTIRRQAPERYLATVHTGALVIDGEWVEGDANIATAVIDDAIEELFYMVMNTYELTHARMIHVTHTPITVNYLKQGWFGVKKFPVTHFIITMLVEDLSP